MHLVIITGLLAQLVASPAAGPGIVSLIPALSHIFVEIIKYFLRHSPSADSRRVVASYKGKYVHKVLVNCLVKLAQEKMWLGELTIST